MTDAIRLDSLHTPSCAVYLLSQLFVQAMDEDEQESSRGHCEVVGHQSSENGRHNGRGFVFVPVSVQVRCRQLECKAASCRSHIDCCTPLDGLRSRNYYISVVVYLTLLLSATLIHHLYPRSVGRCDNTPNALITNVDSPQYPSLATS